MNKWEFKERMNVWEQLWYFKSIAKTSQVSQITHPPAIACCSGIFVLLQSCKKRKKKTQVVLQVGTFCVIFQDLLNRGYSRLFQHRNPGRGRSSGHSCLNSKEWKLWICCEIQVRSCFKLAITVQIFSLDWLNKRSQFVPFENTKP